MTEQPKIPPCCTVKSYAAELEKLLESLYTLSFKANEDGVCIELSKKEFPWSDFPGIGTLGSFLEEFDFLVTYNGEITVPRKKKTHASG